jgi:uncharacterized protein (TIGR03790 family)
MRLGLPICHLPDLPAEVLVKRFGKLSGVFLILISISVGWSNVAVAGGGPENVCVVIDRTKPDSVEVGNYYVQMRGIPACNVFYLNGEPLNNYQQVMDNLVTPLENYLGSSGLSSQINFIVLTRGIPYIPGYSPGNGVDSIASIIFSKRFDDWDGGCDPGDPYVKNPYYNRAEYFDYNTIYTKSGTDPINRRLVMTLDGFSVAGVKRCIDSGVASDESQSTNRNGTIYIITGPQSSGQPRLYPRHGQPPQVLPALESLGIASQWIVVFNEGEAKIYGKTDVLGYMTGTANPDYNSNTYLPGCFEDHLTSVAGDLYELYGGQTSCAHFTDLGASGAGGTVSEPCNYTAKFPNVFLYERLGVGFCLAEAAWQAVDTTWQYIFVGDPLAQPYAVKPKITLESPKGGLKTAGNTVRIKASATHPRGDYLNQMDLFIDGKYYATLAQEKTVYGNIAHVEIGNDVNTDVLIYGDAEAWDVLKQIKAACGTMPNFTLTDPSASGRSGYLKLSYKTTGTIGNGQTYKVEARQGDASELKVNLRFDDKEQNGIGELVGGQPADSQLQKGAMAAMGHIYCTVGRPVLNVDAQVDISSLAPGLHEFTLVAYQGDGIRTQGRQSFFVRKVDIKPTTPKKK